MKNGLIVLFKKTVCVLVLSVISYCSYTSYQVSTLTDPKNDAWKLDLIWNPFSSSVLRQSNELKALSLQSRQRLRVMTFPSLRRSEANISLVLLKERLNLSPFDVDLWDELLSLQRDVGAPAIERLWAMEAALGLYGWNQEFRLRVVAECLSYPTDLLKKEFQLCYQLLTNLPHQEHVWNAAGLGVSVEGLKERLSELPAIYGKTSLPTLEY